MAAFAPLHVALEGCHSMVVVHPFLLQRIDAAGKVWRALCPTKCLALKACCYFTLLEAECPTISP